MMRRNDADTRRLRLLPGLLRRIAELTSVETALKLAQAYPGGDCYIPAKVTPDTVLARVVGLNAAVTIARDLGYGHIMVPAAHHLRLAERRRAMRRDREMGLSRIDLARKYNITTRSVGRILNRRGTDE
jgi:hypothetical protein